MAILVVLVAIVGFTGCASVKSTAQFYMPYTAKYYPPKDKDTPIPILGRSPREPYTAIGKLAFETDLGWNFLRKSMIYNAQMNGADAVVLKKTNSRQQTTLVNVPPKVDYVPSVGYYRDRCGKVQTYTNWIPIFQPGYTMPVTDTIMGIDSEMIVLKK
jgi:hypothetical protein